MKIVSCNPLTIVHDPHRDALRISLKGDTDRRGLRVASHVRKRLLGRTKEQHTDFRLQLGEIWQLIDDNRHSRALCELATQLFESLRYPHVCEGRRVQMTREVTHMLEALVDGS